MDVVGRPPVASMALTEGVAEVANGVRIAHGRLSVVAERRPWISGKGDRRSGVLLRDHAGQPVLPGVRSRGDVGRTWPPPALKLR